MKSVVLALFLLLALGCSAQIAVSYPGGTQKSYRPGDTVHMTVRVRLNPRSCVEGMKKTKIYFSECEDIHNGAWSKGANNIFTKEMVVRIIGKKKDTARVTISRNTDKESLFHQETFNILR